MKNWKRGLGLVAVGVTLMAVMGTAAASAGTTASALPTASPKLSVVQSTSSTGFTDSGSTSTVPLGFLVTNTGNATLKNVVVKYTIDGNALSATCDQTVLLPADTATNLPPGTTTCNATYTALAADVTAGKITSSATASGTDYASKTVTSSASTVAVPALGSTTTPLLPTNLTIPVASPFPQAYVPYADSNDTAEPNGTWTVKGDDSTSTPTSALVDCTQTSTIPTAKASYPGPLCMGDEPTAIFVGASGTELASLISAGSFPVGSSTTAFPAKGQIIVLTSGGYAELSYTSTTPTSFDGIALVSGSEGTIAQFTGVYVIPSGSQAVLRIAVPTSNVQVPVTCAFEQWNPLSPVPNPCVYQVQESINGLTWSNVGNPLTINFQLPQTCPATNFCPTPSQNLVVPLYTASQFVRIQTTGGPLGSYTGNPIQMNVEPTEQFQANLLVNRIVYQPPGALSNQLYTAETDNTTETDLSFGRSNSSVSETNTSYSLDTSLSVGDSWATLNLGYNGSWSKDDTSTNAVSNNTSTGDTITTAYSANYTTPLWSHGTDPATPPWMNDYFDLSLNPQFTVWDFSSCSSGVASQSGTTTACPGGSTVEPSAGIIPTGIGGDKKVTVAQFLPCVKGLKAFNLGDGSSIPQSQCRQIVSQDPFAATALGLVPTPAGQAPGQTLNPTTLPAFAGATALTPIAVPRNGPFGFTDAQSQAESSSYESDTSMDTNLTDVVANTVSVGVSVNVDIPEVVNIDGSVNFSYGQTDTTGQGLTVTTSGTKSFTGTQSFSTTVTGDDPNNAVNANPYFDPRFDTFMFQTTGTPSGVPSITKVAPVSLRLTAGLLKNEKLAAGAEIKVKPTLLPLSKGQKLELPGGQILVTSAAANILATSLHVNAATITNAVGVGATISAIGAVQVTGTGFFNGPIGVSFCTNSTTVPTCPAGANVTVPYHDGGTLVLATTTEPKGTSVGVVVHSQAGSSPGSGFLYSVQ